MPLFSVDSPGLLSQHKVINASFVTGSGLIRTSKLVGHASY